MKKLICLCLVLQACNAPLMSMQGAQRTTGSAGGFDFNVFHTLHQAEAHRTNTVFRPDGKAVFAAARTAIIEVTGCAPDEGSWSGDVALIKVDLLC
ncbi:MAG: hypothetical protein ABJ327_15805 [Litoreibacter sp.]